MGISNLGKHPAAATARTLIVPRHVEIRPQPGGAAPQDIAVPQMRITRIPSAMRSMGWKVSASLMERWFSSPAWEMPGNWKEQDSEIRPREIPLAHIDAQIVLMDWASRFGRCRDAIETLFESKLTSAPTLRLLRKRLADAGWTGHGMFSLGRADMSARDLDHTCQVNFISFGDPGDTMDDMFGSLGEASMKMAFVGRPFRDEYTHSDCFALSHVAFYIRDTYDFNGTQYLGTWTESGVLSKAELVGNALLDGLVFDWHGEAIGNAFNADFRAYRDRTGRGGDFVVYSDVQWRAVNQIIPLS